MYNSHLGVFLACLCLCAYCSNALSGAYSISTYAGYTTSSFDKRGDGDIAQAATISNSRGIHVDAAGNIFLSESHYIRRIDAVTNIISTYAGGGSDSNSENIPALSVLLQEPYGVAGDTAGNIYYSDISLYIVRKIRNDEDRIVSTVQGNVDMLPMGMFYAAQVNLLYIADYRNSIIRAYDPLADTLSVVAGVVGMTGFSGDIAATSSLLSHPSDVFADSMLNLYIADTENYMVRFVDRNSGQMTTIAGNGGEASTGDDGPATSASLRSPQSVCLDSNNDLFVFSALPNEARVVSSGIISRPIGASSVRVVASGRQLSLVNLGIIVSCRADSLGRLILADYTYDAIWVVSGVGSSRMISSKVGFYSGVTLLLTSAPLSGVTTIWGDTASNLYLMNIPKHLIYKASDQSGGLISVFAGTGVGRYNSDGIAATLAALNAPGGLLGDADGNIYISDTKNHRIRCVSSLNTITTVAGSGSSCSANFKFTNVVATGYGLCLPGALALNEASKLLYFANYERSVAVLNLQTGTMSFVTGSSVAGMVDSASLLAARYQTLSSLHFSMYGLYTGESGSSNRIRSINIAGNSVTTLVGTSSAAATGDDGQFNLATLLNPVVAICGIADNMLHFLEGGVYKMRTLDYSSFLVGTLLGNGTVGVGAENVPVARSLVGGLVGCHYDPATDTMFVSEFMNTTSGGEAVQTRIRRINPFSPSSVPTGQPTTQPSNQPSSVPTGQPSGQPSIRPSRQPTTQPSSQPTSQPSGQPSRQPLSVPSSQPTSQPSSQPSRQPTTQPSSQPTSQPSGQPSRQPWPVPSSLPSSQPTSQPSSQPSSLPLPLPSSQPTSQPSSQPISQPSSQPSSQPFPVPSSQPTSQPTLSPVAWPSYSPTVQLIIDPSSKPTSFPSRQPSRQPTAQPSGLPSLLATGQPLYPPSRQPSSKPLPFPTMSPSQLTLFPSTPQPSFALFAANNANSGNNTSAANASLAIAVISSLTSNFAALTVVTEDVRVVSQFVDFVPSGVSSTSTLNVQLPLTDEEIAMQQAGLAVTSVPSISLNVAGGTLQNTSTGNSSGGSSVYVAVAFLDNSFWPTQPSGNTSGQPVVGQLQSGIVAISVVNNGIPSSSSSVNVTYVDIGFVGDALPSYNATPRINFTITCPPRYVVTKSYTCNDTGYVETLQCRGIAGKFHGTCPVLAQTCAALDLNTLTVASGSICRTLYVNSTVNNVSVSGIVCRCGLGGAGFVEGTGSVAAGVVLGLVTSDLSKTFQASTAFGDGSAATKGAVVLSLFCSIWGCAALVVLHISYAKRSGDMKGMKREQKQSSQTSSVSPLVVGSDQPLNRGHTRKNRSLTKAISNLASAAVRWKKKRSYISKVMPSPQNAADVSRSSLPPTSHHFFEVLENYMDLLFPTVFQSKSFLEGLGKELWRKHLFVNLFMRLHESLHPELDVAKMVTLQGFLLFLLALLYDLNYPSDDGSCVPHLTASDCLKRKFIFDPSQSYCSWQVMTFAVVDDDSVYYECVYAELSYSFTTAMYVSMMISLATCLFMDPLEYLFSLLASPSISSQTNTRKVGVDTVSVEPSQLDIAAEARSCEPVSPSKNLPSLLKQSSSRRASFHRHLPAGLSVAKSSTFVMPSADLQPRGIDELVHTIANYRQLLLSIDSQESEHGILMQFDSAWCLDSATGHFLSMSIGSSGNVFTVKDLVDAELQHVKLTAKELAAELEVSEAREEVGFEIMVQFVQDILGGSKSSAARIYAVKMELDYEKTPRVSPWVKICIVLFLVCLNGFFFYFTLLRAISKGIVWQHSYLVAWLLQVVLDVFVFETLQCTWFHYFLPSLARADVGKAQRAVTRAIADVKAAHTGIQHPGASGRRNMYAFDQRSDTSGSYPKLDAPSFLFVSNQLANIYPSLPESQLVKTYKSALPGAVSGMWQKVWRAKAKQYGKISKDNSVKSPAKVPISWLSWLVSWPKRLVVLVVLRVIISAPIQVQSICIRVAEPALFSGVLLLFLLVTEHPVYLTLMCVFIFLVLVAIVWDYLKGSSDVQTDINNDIVNEFRISRGFDVNDSRSGSGLQDDALHREVITPPSGPFPLADLSLSFNSYSISSSSDISSQRNQSSSSEVSSSSVVSDTVSIPSLLHHGSPTAMLRQRRHNSVRSDSSDDGHMSDSSMSENNDVNGSLGDCGRSVGNRNFRSVCINKGGEWDDEQSQLLESSDDTSDSDSYDTESDMGF